MTLSNSASPPGLSSGHPTTLSMFPDEILYLILDLACSEPVRRKHEGISRVRHYDTCRSLALVSRRFNRLAIPFLFENINICAKVESVKELYAVPPVPRFEKLHRLLRDKPVLRHYVKSLRLDIGDDDDCGPHDFDVAHDLLSWTGNLLSLSIFKQSFRCWDDPTVADANATSLISRASQNARGLKCLMLRGSWENEYQNYVGQLPCLTLAQAMKFINFPALQELRMDWIVPSNSDEISAMRSSQKLGSGSFTKLDLRYCDDSMEAVAEFLRWPKTLTDFSFIADDQEEEVPKALETSLHRHKNTLRTLRLGIPGFCNGSTVEASKFPNLERLELSDIQINAWYNIPHMEWHPPDPRLLMGPKLKQLGLTMGSMGHCYVNSYGSREEEWIRQLARAAKDQDAALKTVEVIFLPSDPLPDFSNGEYGDWEWMWIWPWDRLAQLARDIAEYGIHLVYSEPPWSKQEWEALITQDRSGSPSTNRSG